jgi:phenylalanyl-tRNA synthetase beta chain
MLSGKVRLGSLGEIHPTVLEKFGLEKPVFCFELDFEKLVKVSRQNFTATVPSRFPDSTRDIALLAPENTTAETIVDCVKNVKVKEIEQVEIFDVYRGAGIPEGFKSIAIRIRYRSYERTLTDDEIALFHGKVIESLVNKVKVSIR